MDGVRPRKQPAKAANGVERKINGYADLGDRTTASAEPTENIFLFWPNVIGAYGTSPVTSTLLANIVSRLLPHRTGHRIALLHAIAPADVFLSLQHQLSPGCSRRVGGPTIQPIHAVRGCIGHDHGSMYNLVPLSFPQLRFSPVVDSVPGPDQP